MGGMFSPPSPPPPPPPPPVPDPAAEDRQRRLDELQRRRRGRAGTVQTGWRGVLSDPAGPGQGKQKLGD